MNGHSFDLHIYDIRILFSDHQNALNPSTHLFIKLIASNFSIPIHSNKNRILDEKREAFDTIELLKLIGKHQGVGRQSNVEHRPFSPSSSTTSLSTMSSFSSNQQ